MKMSELNQPTPLSVIIQKRAGALTENSMRQLYTGKGLYFTVLLELQKPTFAKLTFRTMLASQYKQYPKSQLLF